MTNPNALFHKDVTIETVMNSRLIHSPIRLLDCSPICDGAAAVILAPTTEAHAFTSKPVRILASSVATDHFCIEHREDPLLLAGSRLSVLQATERSNVHLDDISFYEAHDAFSIMTCLQLESVGFARLGEGWRMAVEKRIWRDSDLPIATMGGLKARGHPIGATAIYQTCEIVLQLTEQAGINQIKNPKIGMLQSIGGAASTVITHLFGT